ncbi:MAG: hypothetical protein RSC74_09270, partial [Hydrogenoanaerobacterium sp.]
YGTNEAVTKDTMAVGESRKYTIRSTNIAKGTEHEIYIKNKDYITIIRGDVFYEGSAVEETITLRLNKDTIGLDEKYGLPGAYSNLSYTPKITNT